MFFFFFQAEDGIRDDLVTGVQTCALPISILTAPHGGRAACHYCGPCERGCITHSYFNSIGVTLPAARATGRLTMRQYSIVHSQIYDEQRGRAAGVRVIDGQTKQPLEFRARVVFLCASTLESTRILLNSKI